MSTADEISSARFVARDRKPGTTRRKSAPVAKAAKATKRKSAPVAKATKATNRKSAPVAKAAKATKRPKRARSLDRSLDEEEEEEARPLEVEIMALDFERVRSHRRRRFAHPDPQTSEAPLPLPAPAPVGSIAPAPAPAPVGPIELPGISSPPHLRRELSCDFHIDALLAGALADYIPADFPFSFVFPEHLCGHGPETQEPFGPATRISLDQAAAILSDHNPAPNPAPAPTLPTPAPVPFTLPVPPQPQVEEPNNLNQLDLQFGMPFPDPLDPFVQQYFGGQCD